MSQSQTSATLDPQNLDQAISLLLSPTMSHQKFTTKFNKNVYDHVTKHYDKYKDELKLSDGVRPVISFDFFFENYRIPVTITYIPQDKSVFVTKFNDFPVHFTL